MVRRGRGATVKIRSRRVLAAARVVHRSVDLFLKKQVTRSAAALSFFLTLSIFPFLLCLNWLIGILNVDISAVGKLFGGFVPGETISIIQDYLAYIAQSRSIPMLVGGLLTMASSSSAAYRTIGNQMDSLYERRQPRRFIHWLASFAASFVFLISVYFCIIILLTGKKIGIRERTLINWFIELLDTHFGIGYLISRWTWIRFLVLFLFVLLMVYGLYRVSAPRQRPRLSVFWGALLTAFCLVVVSVLFSIFITYSTKYSLVYGSLASIIILMVWLYTCCNILFVGSILNVVLFQRRHPRFKRFPAPYEEVEPADSRKE